MPRSTTTPPVDTIDTDTERTPLLAGTPTPTTSASTRSPSLTCTATADDDVANNDAPTTDDPAADETAAKQHLRALLRPRVIILSLLLIFLIELAIGMSIPPVNAIMESVICRQKHPDVFLLPPPDSNVSIPSPIPSLPSLTSMTHHNVGERIRRFPGGLVLVDDPACKQPDVQGYLAMLRGWANTFECVPGIVGAVPYGILSDRWGRKPVVGMGVAGIAAGQVFQYGVLYFSNVVPLWVTWFSAAFQLIGGGGQILVAMFFTALADVVPADERAIIFSQLTAVFLGSQMVAGPLGGAMLIWDPWTPLLVSVAVLVVTILVFLVFPETVHVHDRKRTEEQRPDADDVSVAKSRWHNASQGLAEVWDFVLGNMSLAFLMLSLAFSVLGRFVGELLLQYATDRYKWSWSVASLVLSIRNAGSLVTLLALLPLVSWFCVQRLGMTDVAKDLWLARWSGVCQIVASITVAAAVNGGLFSVGLVWFAFGSGMGALIRSLLNALVEEHHVGIVNSLVGFMEVTSITVAGPLLSKFLGVGLALGGPWIGLPFFTSGLFFVISTAILFIFKLPTGRRSSSVEASC